MTFHSSLLREVAQAIIDTGYAVYPTSAHVAHLKPAIRLAQLQAAQAQFEQQHGYRPRAWQLAIMCNVSQATISRVLKAQR